MAKSVYIAGAGLTKVDLTGQVCADSMGHKIYSGVGGQVGHHVHPAYGGAQAVQEIGLLDQARQAGQYAQHQARIPVRAHQKQDHVDRAAPVGTVVPQPSIAETDRIGAQTV